MSRPPARTSTMRRVRGVLLAGCSATLSVTAHTIGGGQVPHLLTTALLTVLIGWVSTALAERTKGPGGVLLVLGCAQVSTHVVLGHLSGHAAEGPAMALCHGIATVATAVVLARAEAMLAVAVSVLSALRGLLVVRCPAPSGPAAPCGVVPLTARGAHTVEVLLRRANPRRGPPAPS